MKLNLNSFQLYWIEVSPKIAIDSRNSLKIRISTSGILNLIMDKILKEREF